MRGDRCADTFAVFANDHGLEDTRVVETEREGDGEVFGSESYRAEGWFEIMEGVANLVDGLCFGFDEIALRVEGI